MEGDLDPKLGWVMDFAVVKKVIKPLIDKIDHKYMNEIEGLENPTCELIAKWLWDQIKPEIPLLTRIDLHETPTSGVVYRG